MPKHQRLWCLLTLACIFHFTMTVSRADQTISPRFEHIGNGQLLALSSIETITQDKNGFMWFGGENGLSRFDGYKTIEFNFVQGDSYSLSSNSAQKIFVDESGRVWVGTARGLNLFDVGHSRFFRYLPRDMDIQSPSDLYVREVLSDHRGGLWISTHAGLQHFDPSSGAFTFYRHDSSNPNSLVSNLIKALALDDRGSLWIGTSEGLDELKNGASQFIHHHVGRSQQQTNDGQDIRALFFGSGKTLWISSDSGLESWQFMEKGLQRRYFDELKDVTTSEIIKIVEDHDHRMWCATKNDGLLRWDSNSNHFSIFRSDAQDPHSLSANEVVDIFEDRSGSLWVGTITAGLNKVDLSRQSFVRYHMTKTTHPALSGNNVMSITGNDDGLVFMGTGANGLNVLNTKTDVLTTYRHSPSNPNSISGDTVLHVNIDKHKKVWLTTDKGISWFNQFNGTFTRRMSRQGDPPLNRSTTTLIDHDGIYWTGAHMGLSRLDPVTDEFHHYQHNAADPSSVMDDDVASVFEDSHNTIWVGFNSGIGRMEGRSGHFRHFYNVPDDPTSISAGRVIAISEDASGHLWFASDEGISRLDVDSHGTVTFKVFKVKATCSILEDKDHNLWTNANGEITHLVPSTGQITKYTVRDGILEGDCWAGSGYTAKDGTLYFASASNGVTGFRPEKIQLNKTIPPVMFTDIQIFNKSIQSNSSTSAYKLDGPVETAQQLTLPYESSVFSIEFAALHFSDPQQNKYSYQLQGFDKDWVSTDASRRVATYTNLDPGEYTFRVKAASRDDVWNDEGATLRVAITPPFWKTWWFKVFSMALIFSAGLVVYQRRIKRLVEQRVQLEEQVRMRTLELHKNAIELKQANQRLEENSLTDPLTGLRNRRFLYQHMDADIKLCIRKFDQWCRSSKQLPLQGADIVFFLIDLDFFKSVNDVYGHAAGDQVLVQIRQRLEQISRSADFLIRWGGEEFLVVARDTDRRHAEIMAERIRMTISSMLFELNNGVKISKTCSIGFACFPFLPNSPSAVTWSETIEIADHALYLAKNAGRDAWVGFFGVTNQPIDDGIQNLSHKMSEYIDQGLLKISSNKQINYPN